jgi:hypothetical protein
VCILKLDEISESIISSTLKIKSIEEIIDLDYADSSFKEGMFKRMLYTADELNKLRATSNNFTLP